jgi:rod shape-determining protein MreC
VQVKGSGNDAEHTRLIRIWAVDAVTPLERVLLWAQNGTGNIWHNYFYLRGVRAENRDLKLEIERMRIEQVRMSQDADQARRLQALLAFKEQFISKTMAAQVIGSSGSEQSRSVYIDKGEKDGVKPDMAVITGDGVVGKVLHSYSSTSLVLLIDDQSSGVGAILEKSRLQGILRGTPAGEVVLEKVMSDEAVPAGERVLTSGGDRIFPKGLPIGTVTRVSPGSELFLNIRVKPTANLGKLEEVLVVTKIDERQATPEQSVPVRAADILAERLPTVPPKPAETPGGAAPGTTQPVTKPAAGSSVPATGGKPAVKAPTTDATANPTLKPKSLTPAAANGTVPNAPKPAVKTTTTDASSAAGSTPVDASQKTVKPAVEPKPQLPEQDTPQ